MDGPGTPSGEQRVVEIAVQRIAGTAAARGRDVLAVEEPLEIRLDYGPRTARTRRSITVTMRTPGSDVELAVGFLLAEGLVHRREDVDRAESCGPPAGPLGIRNLVRVELAPEVTVDAKRLQRNFLTSSSCGLCGKASLDALPLVSHVRLPDGFVVPASAIHDLPSRLRGAQTAFDRTGGLHAAALFDRDGHLLDVYEDVGRHKRCRQVDRRAVPGAGGPVVGPPDLRERTGGLRAGAEVACRRNPDARGRGRPVEPRGGPS